MKTLRGCVGPFRFVLNLVLIITFLMLLSSIALPGASAVRLGLSVYVLLTIFGLALLVRVLPTLTALFGKASGTELPSISNEKLLALIVLCGVVLLPLLGLLAGPLISLLVMLTAVLLVWPFLFAPIREDIDDDKIKRYVTIAAVAMVLVAIPLQIAAQQTRAQTFNIEAGLFIFWLALYLGILIMLNTNEPQPDLPELIARAGHLRNIAGDDITPQNWSEYKPDKKVKKNKPPEDVLEVTFWPDTAVVVERKGRNPRVLMLDNDDEDNVIKAGEDLRAVVDLRDQLRVDPKVRVLTRDGVPLHIGIRVEFYISRRENEPIEVNPYPALGGAIVNAVYKAYVTPGDDILSWDIVPLELVKNALRDAVSEYRFSDLYDYAPDATPPRHAIRQKINDASIKDKLAEKGVYFKTAFITDIHFDEAYARAIALQWVNTRNKMLDQVLAMPAAEVFSAAAVKTIDPIIAKVQEHVASGKNGAEGEAANTAAPVGRAGLTDLQSFDAVLQTIETALDALLNEDMLDKEQLDSLLRGIEHHRVLLQKQIKKARARAAMADDDDDDVIIVGAPAPGTAPEVSGLDPSIAEQTIDALRQNIKELEKRAERDSQEFEDMLLRMMTVLDNLDRGLANIDWEKLRAADTVIYKYLRGFERIRDQMLKAFREMGVEEVPGVGHPFDPTIHEAVGLDPQSHEAWGLVSRVVKRGFRYQGRQLRIALVWVSDRGVDRYSRPAQGTSAEL